jgi:formylglycine-generating enzyme required for sulfatase activity
MIGFTAIPQDGIIGSCNGLTLDCKSRHPAGCMTNAPPSGVNVMVLGRMLNPIRGFSIRSDGSASASNQCGQASWRKHQVNVSTFYMGRKEVTKAEWEKAARGGLSGKRFPWGDTISHTQANFNNYGAEPYQTGTIGFHPTYGTGSMPYTSPVGSFTANGYGLHDMAGNGFEWCWDCYDAYASGSQTAPRGASSGFSRVVRGGGWYGHANDCRVAIRSGDYPSSMRSGTGFRLARSSVP